MTQDLVQLGQRGLLFRLGDGIGGNDLILHERAQKYLSRRARRRGKNRSTETSQPYPYARGKARVRARGENVDGKGDGEAGQPGVDQSVSGQGRQPVRRVHEQDGLLVQEAGDHLLPWGWRMEDEKKVLRRLLPSIGCVHTINAPSTLEGFSTRPYRALFHLARIARPLHQGEQTHKQLPRTAGKLDNLNFPAKEETERPINGGETKFWTSNYYQKA